MASSGDGSEGAQGNGKLFVYTAMLLSGLACSQVAAKTMSAVSYASYGKIVGVMTMFSLSFLMVKVGHEFDIDRSNLGSYAKDYAVAMSAAGLPWILVALWLYYALPGSALGWSSALLMARFAAPTSAGILFNMLEAAGFKETWLFRKAQILAIFDDLDTILLMIPLKMLLVGFKWELAVDVAFVSLCLSMAWQRLHKIRFPSSWSWTMLYGALVTLLCEGLYWLSAGKVHVEVLLPAFAVGCMTRLCRETDEWCEVLDEHKEENAKSIVSIVFMLLVGLSMPSLFAAGPGQLSMAATAGHVFAVTVLMTIGKMLLLFCYKDEADLRTRLALSLGMCPRGEVGAGVIAISLGLGMQGSAVTVAVLSLAVNLVLSSGFIMLIDRLMRGHGHSSPPPQAAPAPTSMAAVAANERHRGNWLTYRSRGWRTTSRPQGLGLSPSSSLPRLRPGSAAWARPRPLGITAGSHHRRVAVAAPLGCFSVGGTQLAHPRVEAPTSPLGSALQPSAAITPADHRGVEIIAVVALAAFAVGARLIRRRARCLSAKPPRVQGSIGA
eukprot:CAMPEP_0171180676 /NCGR_PEP_ID=MMETSP0790-20130122/13878_1 /TAXON_ID=2925 /ORGANISM="Alexandrium catenella, Strain OF101" /LENGTH=552 /DNA_ID=CAMNT_0011645613 /DNA_START=61 /DNA_END=1719 /DNA_ORIENTATION=+